MLISKTRNLYLLQNNIIAPANIVRFFKRRELNKERKMNVLIQNLINLRPIYESLVYI